MTRVMQKNKRMSMQMQNDKSRQMPRKTSMWYIKLKDGYRKQVEWKQ